ncbi:protein LDOC1-like [Ahaetulla prasina]|uniref:protein LDOC1-like n=1 Tax=Ahaetulla prasina TaxID=499056 RepID=UPI0026492137|nr:protein LDOC1-like [Ahaetulla prasina]
MEELHAKNAQLQQQVALLSAQMAQLQAPASSPPRRRCHIVVPDKFDGIQPIFPAFMGQCQLLISLRMEDFPTDQDKVGFVFNLLSGSAAHWAMPLLAQASPLLDDFRGFCEHLRLIYEDPIKMQTSTR